MTYIITAGCCNDSACVAVCPVQCIRPRPGDPDFGHTEQLHIDPATCIDCGACQDECPVDAVHPDFDVPLGLEEFTRINSEYFQTHPLPGPSSPSVTNRLLPAGHTALRVAVVGAGPAGCYALEALSDIPGVDVSLFDRLPMPFGLVRSGVAPDHPNTKKIAERFAAALKQSNVSCYFNVDVGRDITVAELLEYHHAVIWSGGAGDDRKLGISGEDIPGVFSAREFVGWYNGHPDAATQPFALDGERAVVIGNGNVALDVARTLLLSSDSLRATDMPEEAVQALAAMSIREVVVVGRRGPEFAAFSLGEIMALEQSEDITLAVDPADLAGTFPQDRRQELLARVAERSADAQRGDRVVTLRFGLEPVSINGSGAVESITVRDATGKVTTIETSAIFRAIGYRGLPVADLPFDPTTATLPNDGGRVISPETDLAVNGVYCSGWIKRGPRGTIGTNRVDAQETVDSILQDLEANRLSEPVADPRQLADLLAERHDAVVDKAGWLRIDAAERDGGAAEGRPRKKILSTSEMVRIAHSGI